jgi:hypothetical protein
MPDEGRKQDEVEKILSDEKSLVESQEGAHRRFVQTA